MQCTPFLLSRSKRLCVFDMTVIYHLRVTLEDTKPPIWRDILVPSQLNLEDLHHVIQTAMGWQNTHLHQFIANQQLYGINDDEINHYENDERDYTIAELLSDPKKWIRYEYDFGDSWLHKIELKTILPANEQNKKIRCIKGKRACPPEDCGGIWGYNDLLENLAHANLEEKREIYSWLGEDFDPEYFNIKQINESLQRLKLSYMA